jgi:hypothetical protein
MTDDLKKRWIGVGFCWLVVAFMTFWNINKIESIGNVREKKEIYLMDEQFWTYNAANISQILNKSASLSQEVESSKLGLFEFESNIRNLAIKSGLSSITVTSRSRLEQVGVIPVKISFRSTFQHAAKWLDTIELELPHTRVRHVKIEVDETTQQNKFSVSLYYRYRQSAAIGSR